MFQMPERLNARKELDSDFRAEIVQLPDLPSRVTAPAEPEKRQIRHLEQILQIESEMGQPEQREPQCGPLQKRNGRNPSAGAVDHQRARRKRRLAHRGGRLAGKHRSQHPVKRSPGGIFYPESASRPDSRIPFRPFAADRYAVRRGKQFRKLRTEKGIVQTDHSGQSRL